MPSLFACNVGIVERQYTIRGVPAHLDEALRLKPKRKGVSLNQVLLESLAESVGEEAAKYHDLDELAGSWKTDKALDNAAKAFDKIDPDDWN